MKKRFFFVDNQNLRDQFSSLFALWKNTIEYRKIESALQSGLLTKAVNEHTLVHIFSELLDNEAQKSFGNYDTFISTFFVSEHDAIKNEVRKLYKQTVDSSATANPSYILDVLNRLAGIDYGLLQSERAELWGCAVGILQTMPSVQKTIYADRDAHKKLLKGIENWERRRPEGPSSLNKRFFVQIIRRFWSRLTHPSKNDIPRTKIVGLVVLLVAIGFLSISRYLSGLPGTISYVDLDDNGTGVVFTDDRGKVVNTIDIGVSLVDPLLFETNSGRIMVVGTNDLNNLRGLSGFVIAYSTDGDSLWSYNMRGLRVSENSTGQTSYIFPPFGSYNIIEWMGKARFCFSDDANLVVLARDRYFSSSPSRVSVFDPETGTHLYSFWHLGRLERSSILLTDLNQDGLAEIVLAAPLYGLSESLLQRLNMPGGSIAIGSTVCLEPTDEGHFSLFPIAGFPDFTSRSIRWIELGHPIFALVDFIRLDNVGKLTFPEVAIGTDWNLIYFINYEGELIETYRGGVLPNQFGTTTIPPPIALNLNGGEIKGEWLACPGCNVSVLDTLYNEIQLSIIRELLQ